MTGCGGKDMWRLQDHPKFWSEHLGECQHESLRRGQGTIKKRKYLDENQEGGMFSTLLLDLPMTDLTLWSLGCVTLSEHLRNEWLFFILHLHPHSFLPRRDESCWHPGLYYVLSMKKKKNTIEFRTPWIMGIKDEKLHGPQWDKGQWSIDEKQEVSGRDIRAVGDAGATSLLTRRRRQLCCGE